MCIRDSTVTAYTRSIGPVQINESRFDLSEMERNAVNMPDAEAAEQAMAYLDACRTKEDSCGGVVECVVKGVPAGAVSYTHLATILPPLIAAIASSSQSKTLAGPSCTSISGATAERFTTPVSGARFPFRIASPPVWLYGFCLLYTSFDLLLEFLPCPNVVMSMFLIT